MHLLQGLAPAYLWRSFFVPFSKVLLALLQVGIYMPLYDIFRNHMEELTSQNAPTMTPYVPLLAGSLARSMACITCYPVELARTRMQVYINILCRIVIVAHYFLVPHFLLKLDFYRTSVRGVMFYLIEYLNHRHSNMCKLMPSLLESGKL